jgi:hypothetical protein
VSRTIRLVVMTCSLALVAAVGPTWASATAEECREPAQYDACMAGAAAAYNFCMQNPPYGDPSWCTYQRINAEASCWGDYCFVFPEG